MSKPLSWYFRRHPILYKIRFKLVSKISTLESIKSFCYNDINTKDTIAPLFFDINNLIFKDSNENLSDFKKAEKIAIWLKNNIKGGPGLGKSSDKALEIMIKGGGGVCSDFSQIYNNFCVINDLKVKEWGMRNISTEKSVSGGHSFNEVYCSDFQKWVMIDVAKSILFYHNTIKEPLSAFEFIQFKKENKEILIFSISENIYIDEPKIKNIFLTKYSSPFVITNYNNKTYDYVLNNLYFLPESIIHGLLVLIGKSYNFEFPKEIENDK